MSESTIALSFPLFSPGRGMMLLTHILFVICNSTVILGSSSYDIPEQDPLPANSDTEEILHELWDFEVQERAHRV